VISVVKYISLYVVREYTLYRKEHFITIIIVVVIIITTTIIIIIGPKNGASLHFPEYLENYQR